MTVFMCVTLARNRATSNMPSATVFFVAYRFMFRLEPELPGICSKGHNWSWVIRRLYKQWPQDGSSKQRTPEPAALGTLSPNHVEKVWCFVSAMCVRVHVCMPVPDECQRYCFNPATFAFEDVFHCRCQESTLSWISLIWCPHIVSMPKARFEIWNLKGFLLAVSFLPIRSLVSNLGFLLAVSFSPNKRHCFRSRLPGLFHSYQQRSLDLKQCFLLVVSFYPIGSLTLKHLKLFHSS